MKKLFFIYFLLFQTLVYGCATCQLMTPTAEIELDLKIDDKKLKNTHTKWIFSTLYSDEMLKQYDKNRNAKLDKSELNTISQAMLDYLLVKNMLTKVQYAKREEDFSSELKPNYKNFNLKVLEGVLIFSYDSFVELEITEKLLLSFSFEDDESFFNFSTSSLKVDSGDTQLHFEKNLYLFTASLLFSYSALESEEVKEPKQVVVPKTEKQDVVQTVTYQEDILSSTIGEVKSLFESIKDESNPMSYMLLLFFAYIYGVVHALGPGHGKTLVGSYFLSNERSYSKALFISLAIGVVHTFSAFFLTLIVYYVVETFLAQFMGETIYYTTKVSALIIIGIALYLLSTKYKAYRSIEKVSAYNFSTQPHTLTCSCSSCKVDDNSTDIPLIISAGIIPCPGTVTIFIFSLSLGLYYAGFLSALVMSLGMSSVIFVSALISVAIRKKTSNYSSNIKKYLEYGSLVIILLLGVLLLAL